jgi:alpha-glucosidase
MKLFYAIALATLSFLTTFSQEYKITAPPGELGLHSFYKKYVDAEGIPVVSSWRVPDEALFKVAQMTSFFLENLPEEVAENLRKYKAYVGILARYEGTTDMPEYAHMVNDTSVNWDVRARGLGGTLELPMTSCAEENILCYQIDKYYAEDIFIHEFSHTIHAVGILPSNPEFNDELKTALENAKSQGKWENTYAATNIWEYWAEGVQSWFNVNGDVPEPDGKHNFVNTRQELKEYDPVLYKIIAGYFPEVEFSLSCHCEKNVQ